MIKRYMQFNLAYASAVVVGLAVFVTLEAIVSFLYFFLSRNLGFLATLQEDLLDLLPPVFELFVAGFGLFYMPALIFWIGLVIMRQDNSVLILTSTIPLAVLASVSVLVLTDGSFSFSDAVWSKDSGKFVVASALGGLAYAWVMKSLTTRQKGLTSL